MLTQHKLIAYSGKYIVMPPEKAGQNGWGNLALPNVHAAGGESTSTYPINTKFVDFDRTHIYSYVEGIVTAKGNVGLLNTNFEESVTKSSIAGAVGDTTIAITETSLVDEGDAEANIFAGGYFMSRTNPYSNYRIVSNTAHDGGSVGATECDIVIEEPGLGAIIAANVGACKLNRNPYTALYCRWGGSNEYETVMGVTLILPTAARYQWIQTWGPCHIGGTETTGKGAYKRSLEWMGDGTVGPFILTATYQHQYAGEILGFTYRGSTGTYSWFCFIRLQQ